MPCNIAMRLTTAVIGLVLLMSVANQACADEVEQNTDQQVVKLRVWGLPRAYPIGPMRQMIQQRIGAFRKKYPWIEPTQAAGLKMPSSRQGANTIVTFMQIAGGYRG